MAQKVAFLHRCNHRTSHRLLMCDARQQRADLINLNDDESADQISVVIAPQHSQRRSVVSPQDEESWLLVITIIIDSSINQFEEGCSVLFCSVLFCSVLTGGKVR
jgi:hypothetical protein